MNVYRLHPGTDAFVINGVYLAHIDIIADDEDAALRGADILMPGFNTDFSSNSLNYVELWPQLASASMDLAAKDEEIARLKGRIIELEGQIDEMVEQSGDSE